MTWMVVSTFSLGAILADAPGGETSPYAQPNVRAGDTQRSHAVHERVVQLHQQSVFCHVCDYLEVRVEPLPLGRA